MKPKRDILSSQMALRFANTGKRSDVAIFLEEYRRVAGIFAARFQDIVMSGNALPQMPSGAICEVETWLSARSIQCVAKQVAGVVNGAYTKNKRREWQAQKFEQSGERAKARKLRQIIKDNPVGKIDLKSLEAQLDARFFKLDKSEKTKSFDFWMTLGSLGKKLKICLPLKSHKHLNGLLSGGRLMPSIRLSDSAVSISVETEKVELKLKQGVVGLDIGQKSVFSASNKTRVVADKHGHTLDSINGKMAKCKRGSKAFKRSERHRKNFVRWSVNQLNFNGVSTVRIEKIRGMKSGRGTSRKLSHWSYPEIFGALKARTKKLGVQVEEVNPRWTSQRCSCCGWVRKRNRKAEQFRCDSCGHTANADINAAINISLHLSALPKNAVKGRMNLKGFFWPEEDESIVRLAQKPEKSAA